MQHILIFIVGILLIWWGVRAKSAPIANIVLGSLAIIIGLAMTVKVIQLPSKPLPDPNTMTILEKAEFICGKGKVSNIDLGYSQFFSIRCDK